MRAAIAAFDLSSYNVFSCCMRPLGNGGLRPAPPRSALLCPVLPRSGFKIPTLPTLRPDRQVGSLAHVPLGG